MTFLRSVLFGVMFYGGTILIALLYLPLLLLPSSLAAYFIRGWLNYCSFCIRWVAGIRHKVTLKPGAVLPKGPVIYAAKHQSAWETLIFNLILPDPVLIFKAELKKLPFFGWYLHKSDHIMVDRAAGGAAMRRMLAQARNATAKGQSIIIYPQGTRVAPDEKAPYHPGVFALYRDLNLPVIPVALNSGLFWRRNGFTKRAGTVTVTILPPISEGLDRRTFLQTLEQNIEAESETLLAE